MKSTSGVRGVILRAIHWLLVSVASCGGIAQAQTADPEAAIPFVGSLAVDQSGALVYTLPIQVPPGLAGMEPKLEVSYSSQKGNGLLGIGWSLSGLSMIGRCPPSRAVDGVQGHVTLTGADKFCLDGQKLLVVEGSYGASGSSYRTELDGFSRIDAVGGTQANGPDSFVVRTKSGLRMEYGAVVRIPGKTAIRGWALNRVQDVKGNYYTIEYKDEALQASGDFLPEKISYMAHVNGLAPQKFVTLEYETRPDTSFGYEAGAVYKSSKRLKRIKTFVGSLSALASDYTFEYKQPEPGPTAQSRLAKITRCSELSYGGTRRCQPPLTFGWEDGARGPTHALMAHPLANLAGSPPVESMELWRVMLADVNGDGKTDVIGSRVFINQICYRVFIATGSGQFEPKNSQCLNGAYDTWVMQMADVNGDGRADLVGYMASAGNLCVAYFPSQGDGSFEQRLMNCVGPDHDEWKIVATDLNHDGRADLLGYVNKGAAGMCYRPMFAQLASPDFSVGPLTCIAGNHSRWRWTLGDVNADGRPDLIGYWTIQSADEHGNYDYAEVEFGHPTYPCTRVLLGAGSGETFTLQPGPITCDVAYGVATSDSKAQVGDFNGDGKADLLFHKIKEATLYYRILLGDGTGAFVNPLGAVADTTIAIDVLDPVTSTAPSGPYSHLTAVDIDGDGRSDIAVHSTGPAGFAAQALLTRLITPGSSDGKLKLVAQPKLQVSTVDQEDWNGVDVGDFDGDGKIELMAMRAHSGGLWAQRVSPAPERNLLARVDNMTAAGVKLAPSNAITYRPATDPAVHVKGIGSVYPLVDMQVPLPLVSAVAVDDGVGGISTVTYSYEGMRADLLSGRGGQGFRKTHETSALTTTTISREFRQDWPFTGAVIKEETTIPGKGSSGVLKRVSTAMAQSTGSAPGTVFVYTQQTSEASWDLDGTALPSLVTTYSYDNNPLQTGDVTKVVVQTSDGTSKTVDNVYKAPDLDKWILGRLQRSTVTHSLIPPEGGTPPVDPNAPSTQCTLKATMSEDPFAAIEHLVVPYGAQYVLVATAPGLPAGSSLKWNRSVDGSPMVEIPFVGNVSTVGTFPYFNTNTTSSTQTVYMSARIGGEGSAGCTTTEVRLDLGWPIPRCELSESSAYVPFGETYTWTVSGANLPPDVQMFWYESANGVETPPTMAGPGLGTHVYSHDDPTAPYTGKQHWVVGKKPTGEVVCQSAPRYQEMLPAPVCNLTTSSNTILDGETMFLTVSGPQGLGSLPLPAGAQTYFTGNIRSLQDPSIVVNDLGAGVLAGAAPGTYAFVNDAPGKEGIYTRAAEVRNARGIRLCTTAPVEVVWHPAPATCSLNVSSNSVPAGEAFTYLIEGQRLPAGSTAYLLGNKCEYAFGNCVPDMPSAGSAVPGGVPTYPTYSNSPGMAGHYTRRAEIRNSAGGVVCSTNSVNVTLQEAQAAQCQLSVSPSVVPPGGSYVYSISGQNLPAFMNGYWSGQTCAYAWGGCVDNVSGEPITAPHVTMPLVYQNTPGSAGVYTRKATLYNEQGGYVCTTNGVGVILQ